MKRMTRNTWWWGGIVLGVVPWGLFFGAPGLAVQLIGVLIAALVLLWLTYRITQN